MAMSMFVSSNIHLSLCSSWNRKFISALKYSQTTCNVFETKEVREMLSFYHDYVAEWMWKSSIKYRRNPCL